MALPGRGGLTTRTITAPVSETQEEQGNGDVIIQEQDEDQPFAKKQKPSKTRVTAQALDPDHYRQKNNHSASKYVLLWAKLPF